MRLLPLCTLLVALPMLGACKARPAGDAASAVLSDQAPAAAPPLLEKSEVPTFNPLRTTGTPGFDELIVREEGSAGGGEPGLALTDTCACNGQARIKCTGSTRPGFAATANPRTCEMFLNPDTCLTLGFVNNRQVNINRILDSQAYFAQTMSAEMTQQKLDAMDIYVHEARHLCDGPSMRACQSEANAFTMGMNVQLHWHRMSCGTITEANRERCSDVAQTAFFNEAGAYVNRGECAGSSAQSVVDTCSKMWGRLYCEELGSGYLSRYATYRRPMPEGVTWTVESGAFVEEGKPSNVWTVTPTISGGRLRSILMRKEEAEYDYECSDGRCTLWKDCDIDSSDPKEIRFRCSGTTAIYRKVASDAPTARRDAPPSDSVPPADPSAVLVNGTYTHAGSGITFVVEPVVEGGRMTSLKVVERGQEYRYVCAPDGGCATGGVTIRAIDSKAFRFEFPNVAPSVFRMP